VADVSACARGATPAIVQRAISDPWWAATSAFQVWMGSTRPEQLLVQVAPNCQPAVAALRPFLSGAGA
jgi:hypothetical protein